MKVMVETMSELPDDSGAFEFINDIDLDRLLSLADDHIDLREVVSMNLNERQRRHLAVCPTCRRQKDSFTQTRPPKESKYSFWVFSLLACVVVAIAVSKFVPIQPRFSAMLQVDTLQGPNSDFPTPAEFTANGVDDGIVYFLYADIDGVLRVKPVGIVKQADSSEFITIRESEYSSHIWAIWTPVSIEFQQIRVTLESANLSQDSTSEAIAAALRKINGGICVCEIKIVQGVDSQDQSEN